MVNMSSFPVCIARKAVLRVPWTAASLSGASQPEAEPRCAHARTSRTLGNRAPPASPTLFLLKTYISIISANWKKCKEAFLPPKKENSMWHLLCSGHYRGSTYPKRWQCPPTPPPSSPRPLPPSFSPGSHTQPLSSSHQGFHRCLGHLRALSIHFVLPLAKCVSGIIRK